MNTAQAKLLELLNIYHLRYIAEARKIQCFRAFIHENPDCCERRLVAGHITGSAWLVSNDGQRALLMHHKKLDRWLQPGGHADGEWALAQVALREAQEETGLTQLSVQLDLFDIDRHRIPARGLEPAHWHYDLRFVVRAEGAELFSGNAESLALAWFEIAKLAEDGELDASIRRMAQKWLKLGR